MDALLVFLLFIMAIFVIGLIYYSVRVYMKMQKIKREEEEALAELRQENAAANNKVKVPTPKYKLEQGGKYFLFDKRSNTGYTMAKAYMARGKRMICVTCFNPEKLQKRYSLSGSKWVYLTRKKAGSDDEVFIPPTNLGLLIQELKEMMVGSELIYIDCGETLYEENGYDRTNKFLSQFIKLTKKDGAIVLLSFDKTKTNKKIREHLKRNLKELGAKKEKK